jgi:1-acyl-sn-glycerol-3-phosphate acyltransferase
MGIDAYRILRPVFFVFWHCRLSGRRNIPDAGPAVFVSNHLGSYAPLAVLSAFPVRLYPWVVHQVVDWRLCADYLRQDFIEPELRLKPLLSKVAALVIAGACLALMKLLRAVPVYEKSMRLATTWKQSVELLNRKKFLAIFPENGSRPAPEALAVNEFDHGFVGVAALYYKKTGRVLNFIPIAVNKAAKAITVGPPIAYKPENKLALESERIATALRDKIIELYASPGR